MKITDLIAELKLSLAKENVLLRSITTTNTNKAVEVLRKEGVDVTQITYPFPSNDFQIGDMALLRDYPWREEYIWEQNLTRSQFLAWRPFFKVVEKFKNPVGAEVGVLEGYLSKNIIENIKPSIFYLIDPWKEFFDSCGNIKFDQTIFDLIYQEVNNKFNKLPNVVVLRKTSLEASKEIPDNSLDFVYIDADHSAESVHQDINIWLPKVRDGGVIGGHDYTEPPVKSGIYRFLLENKEKEFDLKCGYNDWWFFKNG